MIKENLLMLFSKDHKMIVDENEIVSVLKALEIRPEVLKQSGLSVRHAGWENKPERWIIKFRVLNHRWSKISKELVSIIKSAEIIE